MTPGHGQRLFQLRHKLYEGREIKLSCNNLYWKEVMKNLEFKNVQTNFSREKDRNKNVIENICIFVITFFQ